MAEAFNFELVSPERLLVSEDVESVLVPGTEGDMTILKNHAPLITTLKPGLLDIVFAGGREARYFVKGGFAEANPSGLTVLAETAINRDDLDAAKMDQAIKDAEEDVADAEDPLKRDKVQIHLDYLRQVKITLGL
ncbi:ATP synthase epsilon chain [Methyloligella halotolerans]|uniref:ATP synthase epsilon chain n=1 Tax=Methyloligella halotolerans TaxID=1177755 RepID=A0A1E2S111_9HYPH|nr:F0F1 ATP synthase subunit epsilon [Methyloligella halotolerans]ODA68144.1 ATP synthase epsilon chain [Methyloligella halotolerans]